MSYPISTYRIQLHKEFNFRDLQKIIPYLQNLGATTIYASPFFEARPGSPHGYDVTNPLKINPEIGTLGIFREIAAELKQRGMMWVQDIVPNHMSFSYHNKFLMDVFERGPQSTFYHYFDINWDHHADWLKGKLIAPFLGSKYEEALKNGELQLVLDENGLAVKYFEQKFSLSLKTYQVILSDAHEVSKSEEISELMNIVNDEMSNEDWINFKQKFLHFSSSDQLMKSTLEKCNKPEKLDQLLALQHFKLTRWRKSEEAINYRRFFTINELICLKMRDEAVFEHYHQFIKQLVDEDLVQGLRIDHIDGLFDPHIYLQRLRILLGENKLLKVEKILEADELMPHNWPVEGSTGYDFLAYVNQFFTEEKNKPKLEHIYKKFVPEAKDFEDVVFSKKMLMLINFMSGEFDNMLILLEKLDLLPRQLKDAGLNKLIEAFAVYLISYPVYRIHGNDYPLTEEDVQMLETVFERAMQRAPHLEQQFSELKRIFNVQNLENPDHYREKIAFFMRCQQLAVPLTAKGVEDTAFYIYNKLISHNEVGDSPAVFAISTKEFHRQMQRRLERMPHTLNATSTHDTKRGEDVRMRINVLSELPDLWEKLVLQWKEINKDYKKLLSANDEYFFYQTLIGVWPVGQEKMDEELLKRLQEYFIKSIREAKEHSDWSNQNKEYEHVAMNFIAAIGQDEKFLKSLFPFARKVAHIGAIYSLGQILIKITAPGIPDIYQGCEYWNLFLVDPDNRREVNYEVRQQTLEDMQRSEILDLAKKFKNNLLDENLKLFITWKGLQARREYPQPFSNGEYIPLAFEGRRKENLIGFIRRKDKRVFVTLAAIKMAENIIDSEKIDKDFWSGTFGILPEISGKFINIFDKTETVAKQKLDISECFANLPVALLQLQTAENESE